MTTEMKNTHKQPKNATPHQIIDAVVAKAVGRYRAKCWWADKDDLTQEGWAVALQALKTWNPKHPEMQSPDDFYWYAWRAVVIQLRNLLLRGSAPVTAPQRKLIELEGMHRAPESKRPELPEEPLPDASEVLAEHRKYARLRLELRAAVLQAGVSWEMVEKALVVEDDAEFKAMVRQLRPHRAKLVHVAHRSKE